MEKFRDLRENEDWEEEEWEDEEYYRPVESDVVQYLVYSLVPDEDDPEDYVEDDQIDIFSDWNKAYECATTYAKENNCKTHIVIGPADREYEDSSEGRDWWEFYAGDYEPWEVIWWSDEASARSDETNTRMEGLSNYLNKETGRYDYLNREFTPEDLIKDGKFIVPIGIWKGNFNCSNTQLTSLEGAPRVVGGHFNCHWNSLTSLEGAPEKVEGHFVCSNNKLTSLVDAPREVGGDFRCEYNKLTSLEGAPREVKGTFYCYSNKLTSLKGAPEKVGGSFWCGYNKLTSLEGAPREVGGDFNCYGNPLTSLEGKPEHISGKFLARA